MKTTIVLISVILATNSLRAEDIQPPSSQKIITTNADGGTTVSILNQNKKPTQISDFDAGGRLRQKKLLRYDSNGHVVFSITSQPDGKIRLKEAFQYDPKGKLVATQRTLTNGTVWVRQESFDENGNHKGTRIFDSKANEISVDEWDKAN